jgi:hypothetical protein
MVVVLADFKSRDLKNWPGGPMGHNIISLLKTV